MELTAWLILIVVLVALALLAFAVLQRRRRRGTVVGSTDGTGADR